MAILSYKTEQNIQTRNVLIGSAEEGLGRAQMGLNNKKTGLAHFIKAVGYIDEANLKNTFLAAEIYKSLGKAYLENNSADSAKFYLKKAMQITKNSDNLSLKQSIYKCTSEVYKKNKMIDSFVFYDSKFNDLLQKNNAKKRATVNLAYRTLNTPQEEAYSKASYVVMGTGVLTCFFIIGFVFKKRKKTANEVKKEYFINNAKTPELVLSQKLEDEILKNLNKFEHSKAFLDKSMSLSTLIGKMNTNTKYFRYVLKKHKEKDFKGYINELRIKYIVRKLKTDPQYLNFKISYLANESGFSSHSKFSAVFKQVMGLSPSEFIENINHNI
ncbi:helix-turn-helix domain-containing protein [Mariniflexile ostreae]|uniref:Helix-turn-helix domain-containing protein n=1 Tax=Mariniflexile ostreae TaxID=1520892 RepID=A0ABV5FF16_9FLAO